LFLSNLITIVSVLCDFDAAPAELLVDGAPPARTSPIKPKTKMDTPPLLVE
jgi:hypothetical protein